MFFCLLHDRDNRACTTDELKTPSHFFNTFFMARLLDSNGLYTFDNVKKWTQKLSILLLDKVFIPINVGNSHSVLLVAYIKLKKIKYYDSMGGDGKVYVDAAVTRYCPSSV